MLERKKIFFYVKLLNTSLDCIYVVLFYINTGNVPFLLMPNHFLNKRGTYTNHRIIFSMKRSTTKIQCCIAQIYMFMKLC